ncbi:MAG: TonB-dependent receptor [Hyphomicrobiaceae bacterium]|nr:TonB-dependent receptor [Hyphomicrobiaceae bacterium]
MTRNCFVSLAGLIAGSLILSAAPVRAQDIDLGDLLILPNRVATPAGEVGASIDVVGRDEIERSGVTTLSEALELLPGVTIAANGPRGSQASVFVRGAASRYVVVLVDGIEINDPTGPQVQLDFGRFGLGDVERIELLKGSQSVLYGGDAVAGVINIVTRRAGGEGVSFAINGEAGAFGTVAGAATLGYRTERGDIALTVQGERADGFSAAEEEAGNTEADGFRNVTVTANGSYQVNDFIEVFASLRRGHAVSDFDESFPAIADDPGGQYHGTTSDLAARIGTTFRLFDGMLENTVTVSHYDVHRDIVDGFPRWFEGTRDRLEYQGTLSLSERFRVVFGGDVQRETAEGGSAFGVTPQTSADIRGLYIMGLFEPFDGLNLTLGGRIDDHSTFGTFETVRGTASYQIAATGTTLRASAGTGFRAPSLYELFDSFAGNPALQPEESLSLDAGIEQSFWGGRARLGVTWFLVDVTNAIDYSFATFAYVQTSGESRRQGVEVTGAVDLTDWMALSGAYTYTETEDPNGARLLRVPRHDATLQLRLMPMDNLTLAVTARGVVDTLDLAGPLDDYLLVNALATYRISDNAEVYVRGVNLLDDSYQTLDGYGTSDRAFYAGFRVRG